MGSEKVPSKREPGYAVVWPLGKTVVDSVAGTSPVTDLRGKTVCELWDMLFKGDEMFSIVRRRLMERYADVKFVDFSVFGNTHGPKEKDVIAALPRLLREHGCGVVISGVGA